MKDKGSTHTRPVNSAITLSGAHLSLNQIADIAQGKKNITITDDVVVLKNIQKSYDHIQFASLKRKPIYGVNTPFGGMANQLLSHEETQHLQTNLLYFLKSGAGDYLNDEYVRAAMLILVNSLLKGFSGIRYEIISRYAFFLNNKITPRVRELGSIGASGDLVPMASVAGAVTGLADCFKVNYQGVERGMDEIHQLFHLERITLHPKEGLALVNSTAMLTAIAAINMKEMRILFALALHAHVLPRPARNDRGASPVRR